MREILANNLKNIPGKPLKDKIVIIECDDWGGIRMPSKLVYNRLLQKNIPFNTGHFDKYDTIESKEDLQRIFELLQSFKDSIGNYAVMTPFVNVANPWFEKIKECDFEQYIYETYPQTLERYGRDEEIISLLRKGVELNIFVPEFHGREHLAVPIWLNELKSGNKDVVTAFEYGYTTVNVNHYHPVVRGFRAEFFFNQNSQKQFLVSSIKDGVSVFEKLYGYKPNAFAPGNGVFHADFETELMKSDIKFMNVNRKIAEPDGNGGVTYHRTYYTKYNSFGLTKYLRNCLFEPSAPSYNGVHQTLKQIEGAFRWMKPAILSTHRVNFAGSIDETNRNKGLKELQILLRSILRKWPSVKFMSTREFFQSI